MEVNRELACAELNVGAVFSNQTKFTEVVGMFAMTLKTHQYCVDKIFKSMLAVTSSVLQEARERLWQHSL